MAVKNKNIARPLVSVITVVYNKAATLQRCMDSISRQSYENIEYILVDGGSTDGTLDLIKENAAHIDHYVSEPDDGIYHAMNKGLDLASGEYIAFLNADDYYLSDAVEASIEHILANDLDLSYAGFHYADENGRAILADEGREWDDSMLIQGIPGGHETVFAHRRCYETIGGYDLSFKLAADYHWLMRAYKAGLRALPLRKTILVMATGGASFDEFTEKSENYRLLRENFGNLDESTLERLYQLKFYKNWHGNTVPDPQLLELLSDADPAADEYRRALLLTVKNRKRPVQGTIVPATAESQDKLTIAIALTFLTGVSGGAERIAIEMANELARRGHAVTVVSCHGLAGGPYYPLDRNIPCIDLAIHPYKQYYDNAGKNFHLEFDDISGRHFEKLDYTPTEEDFSRWRSSGHLWRTRMYHGFFQEHNFDLVISHMPSTFPYVLLGRDDDNRATHIAALHNAPEFKFYSELYPADSMMDRYMRLVSLEKADRISILFDAFREQMPPPYREKCFTLPNFTGIAQQASVQESLPPGKIILSVGRLAPQKGHATLLRSYAKVKKTHPDWALHIYGDGPLKQELVKLCSKLGLSAGEIFKGVRQDIEAAYQEAGIFAFPSIFEGFGLTLVEAMAFGLPVIGFDDCEGVKYLIENEQNGLLISRENDSDTMAAAINRLIESPGLRSALGNQGKETAKHYTLQASTDALEHVMPPGPMNYPEGANRKVPGAAEFSTAILTTYLAGGAGIAATRLQHALLQEGSDTCVFSLSPDSSDEHRYQTELTPSMQAIFNCFEPFFAEENRVPGSTIVSPCYPSLTADQLNFLGYFDIINIHWIQRILSNEAVAHLSKMGKPLVWTMHDMNPFTGGCHYTAGCEKYQEDCHDCPQLNDTYNDFTAKVLAAKKHHWSKDIVLVSPSHWLAGCARKSAVFRHNRIEVIPNSIDTETFRPTPSTQARQRLNLPQDKKILLFTSHSHGERRKGFKELVETVETLETHPETYHIVTFGEEAPEISKLGLPYTALGYTTDEKTLALGYSAADVTVLPTLEDNLPNTILESVACGTPVAAFDSGGVGEAVIDNVTGYLVPRGDCKGLAEIIQRAVNEDFIERCRTHALKEFSMHVQAARYLSLFKELSEQPRPVKAFEPAEIFTETAPELTQILARQLATNQAELRNLRKQRNQLQHFKNQFNSMHGSRSWRYTRPLRAIRMFFKDNRKFRQLLRQKLAQNPVNSPGAK